MSIEPHRPNWRYTLLISLLALPLLLYTVWQAFQARSRQLLKERLGFGYRQHTERPVWIHAASVGEVNAARLLIEALRQERPALPICVSTVTATGAISARNTLPTEIEHHFLPLDLCGPVRRFLDAIKPRCALIIETELWPRLYSQCALRTIPLLVVNGRLSSRTLKQPRWIRHIYHQTLQNVTQVLARDEEDGREFIALGLPSQRLKNVGNIKFTAPQNHQEIKPLQLPRPYLLAASTSDDEEQQLATMWRDTHLGRDYLLVIAPRHPKRRFAILKQLAPFGEIALRSRNDPVTLQTTIYLADTFGELASFIRAAEMVFVGGSLIPKGGQNILEVARLGKVALFGPHMENFVSESALLLQHRAAIQVASCGELAPQLQQLFNDKGHREEMGEKAQQLVVARSDMAKRYATLLRPYLL